MSEDLIKLIQNLIDSGKGDTGRLNYILNTLKTGKPLFSSDQKYLDSLLSGKIVQKEIEKADSHYSHADYQPKFCGKCGASILTTNEFCTECGFPTKNMSNLQANVMPQNNINQLKPKNIQSTNRKAVRKAAIALIISLIPIGILIYAIVNFTIPGLVEGNQRVNEANNGVDKASMNVLSACGDLYNQFQNIEVENGPGSDQLNQFVQGSSDGIKSCITSLQSIQDSCKVVPSMQVCKDSRLKELSGEFSIFKP